MKRYAVAWAIDNHTPVCVEIVSGPSKIDAVLKILPQYTEELIQWPEDDKFETLCQDIYERFKIEIDIEEIT